MRTHLTAALAAAALLTAACADQDAVSPVGLEGGSDAVEVEAAGDDTTDTTGDDTADDTTDDTSDPSDPPADEDAGSDDTAADSPADAFDPWTSSGLAAEPGRWAVGDAGTVEFDRTDDGLTLLDVTEAEGWNAKVSDESADEIEVEFRRGDVKRKIEVEIDDGRTEVDVDTEIDRTDPGAYDVGAAGSFEFAVESGALRLVDVVVADGWELRVDDESDDEFEFTLSNGAERWWVEVEFDDGHADLEIDYRVRG